jgi:hypothetical protein
MSMEHWWNDTDRGKLKYWDRNIIHLKKLPSYDTFNKASNLD